MIPVLRERFRCVAVDLPGFGLSEAPPGFDFSPPSHSRALEQVVHHLDLEDVVVVGQDWGGPTGLGVAVRHPARIARIVVGNTFAWPLGDDPRVRRFSSLMGGAVGRTVAWSFNGVVRFFLREGIRRGISSEERRWYLAPFADRASRYPTWFFPAQLVQASAYLAELESALPLLADRPALMLWATKDFAFGDAYRERFQRLLPKHEVHALDGAGHFWQEDEGERAARTIMQWIGA